MGLLGWAVGGQARASQWPLDRVWAVWTLENVASRVLMVACVDFEAGLSCGRPQ